MATAGSSSRSAPAALRESAAATTAANKDNAVLCCFCQQKPAAVAVRLPKLSKKRKSTTATSVTTTSNHKLTTPQPFCLLHYYTTSAVRSDADNVTVLNQAVLDEQLPSVQGLFAEAYVTLQSELHEEQAQLADPLSIVHNLHNNNSRKGIMTAPKAPSPTKGDDAHGGGFLRAHSVPERLARTQQEQEAKQKEMMRRMFLQQQEQQQGATRQQKYDKNDPTKKRKASRKSIWNVVMDDKNIDVPLDANISANHAAAAAADNAAAATAPLTSSCPACGSANTTIVHQQARITADMAKGETWGNKDRGDEVLVQYRCNDCGKPWTEQE